MSKIALGIVVAMALLLSVPAFAVDGVVLINQATVMAAGGFPYKITQSGSYKLSGNLVVTGAADGIDILADNVTVDLGGFTISGPAVCTGSGATVSCGGPVPSTGINTPSANLNVAVRNGRVVGFGEGVNVLSGARTNGGTLVEEIQAGGNQHTGIAVSQGIVRHCTANANGGDGIVAEFSTVVENVASFNGTNGLFATGGVYGSNTFYGNGVAPVYGLSPLSQNNNYCGGSVC